VADHRADDPDNNSNAPSYPALHVDLDSIDDFVAAMRTEIADNLQPHINQLIKSYELGVCFGQITYSENLAATQMVYHDCLTRIGELLTGYVTAGQVLTSAAARVAATYRRTDAMAAAKTRDVSTAISAQVQAVRDALANRPTPAPAGPDRHYPVPS
jgi:hypothetical protein